MRPFVVSVLFIFIETCAFGSESIWTHNGSKIRWEAEGQRRTASYLELRQGLSAAGIKPGTKLFEGSRKGAILSGNSYSFKNGCEPIAFPVSATITNERQILLTGEAPIRGSGCTIEIGTKTVTLHLDFIPDEASSDPLASSPRIPEASADIPKPSASVQQKLNALKKEDDDMLKEVQQGSSFTVCNATKEKMSVAFGRNRRVRGWTTVHSGTCELIEKMNSPQTIKFYGTTRTREFTDEVLDLTCVENGGFSRSEDEPCDTGRYVGFVRKQLKRGEHYRATLKPAPGQPEEEIAEGD